MDRPRRPPQENPQTQTSPSSSTSSSSNGGLVGGGAKPPTTPTTTNPPRFESNPYPTTFVQADTSSFKQVVQMLTGSSTAKPPSDQPSIKNPIPTGPKKPSFKLYERRSSLKNGFKLSPLAAAAACRGGAGLSPRKLHPPEILSPSILDFPSLVLSPVTPLVSDPFNRASPMTGGPPNAAAAETAEERAIAEKGYYLHPSPRGAEPPPRLLPLFPVTSPRAAATATVTADSDS